MLATEARQFRRILGRMERGEEVAEALLSLAHERNIRSAWVNALGAFEWVELVEYDQVQRVYKPPQLFNSPCEILSLTGNISLKEGVPFVHLHAAVSRETDNGIQVLGGHLLRGLVFACEFMVVCCDDLALQRRHDAATGLDLWSPELGSISVSGTAARAIHPTPLPSAGASSEPDLWSPSEPEVGDWLEHPQYGLCQVQDRMEDDSLIVRLPSGALKTLRLDYFRLSSPRKHGPQRVFSIRPRRT